MFTDTSTEFFNHSVHDLQDNINGMEQKYKLTDPKAILKDPEYPLLWPQGIIAFFKSNTLIFWQNNSRLHCLQ